jgi:hypothetical protein
MVQGDALRCCGAFVLMALVGYEEVEMALIFVFKIGC